MACVQIDLGGGAVAITCGRRRGRPPCASCGLREQEVLCDEPLRGSREGHDCRRGLCRSCAISIPPGVDLCEPHARDRRGRARVVASSMIAEGGLPLARAFYAQRRGRALDLLGLADALRAAGHRGEAESVVSRVDAAIVTRMGWPS
jgi:hypothetical protein